jgi:hypothetical protein
MVFSYKDVVEEVEQAKRMLDYAVTKTDVDNAIRLLSLNMDKLNFAVSATRSK